MGKSCAVLNIPRFLMETVQVSISERKKEINARRKRRETLRKMKSELPKADAAKKAVWAAKLRKMTPGAEALIKEWGLE